MHTPPRPVFYLGTRDLTCVFTSVYQLISRALFSLYSSEYSYLLGRTAPAGPCPSQGLVIDFQTKRTFLMYSQSGQPDSLPITAFTNHATFEPFPLSLGPSPRVFPQNVICYLSQWLLFQKIISSTSLVAQGNLL